MFVQKNCIRLRLWCSWRCFYKSLSHWSGGVFSLLTSLIHMTVPSWFKRDSHLIANIRLGINLWNITILPFPQRLQSANKCWEIRHLFIHIIHNPYQYPIASNGSFCQSNFDYSRNFIETNERLPDNHSDLQPTGISVELIQPFRVSPVFISNKKLQLDRVNRVL